MRITKVPLRDRLGAPGVLGLLLVALLTLGSAFTVPAANAATTNVSITNAQLDKSSAGSGDKIRMSFNWAVPDGAQPGDTFTIVLPAEVRPASTAKFDLERSPGEVVAEGRWSGNTATFTLAEFVRGKQNIQGSAYFSLAWNRDNVNTIDGADYDLHFTGTSSWTLPLTLLPDGPAGTGQSNSKVGWWLSDDQGSVTPKGQLGWVVYLNTGTSTPVDPTITITDTPGAGSHIDLDSVEGYLDNQPLRKERYSVSRLGEHGVSITLVGNYPGEQAVYDGENIYFRYASDLLPGEKGVFTNSATITGNSDSPQHVTAEVRRDGAGGDGSGNQPPEKKVAPVAPTVTQAICTQDGTATAPTVTVAETAGVTYTTAGDMKAGSVVTVTASAGTGSFLTPAEGWTVSADKNTATIKLTLEAVSCDQPVAPVTPTVTQAICTEDGTATAPTVTVAETAGVTYEVAGEVKTGSTVTVTATANEGSFLTEAGGWTLAADGRTATIEITLDVPKCTTKTPTTTPPPIKPGAEQHTPPAAHSPIAATGLASAPVFLGSAALLVLVGLMVVGARRKA
ncbi:Ig-like domain-containing protein [Leucobacter aridicollis]|uniref:Ig-like domain-containing protein n=1 Tax=Leucobacter aridicollis TaxID=283878 RepID=UPI002102E0C3|nr:Ig-like domain-containing protein [Leucobacter aridicollis]UTX53354.1 hypothetical protein KI794_00895 [Leucobacter aridicollis]